MNAPRPRASSLALALCCAYPWTSGDPWPKEDDTPPIRWGNAVHYVAEFGPSGVDEAVKKFELDEDQAAVLVLVAESIADCVAVVMAQAAIVLREVRVAYDPIVGVSRALQNGEQPREGEWHGRADLVAFYLDGTLEVIDWKSGRGTLGRRPAELIQIRTYALMYAALPDIAGRFSQVRIAIGQVTDGELRMVWDTAPSLLIWEADLFDIAAELAKPPEPKPGPWCGINYCPVRASCPATQALARRADEAAALLPMTGDIQTEADALAWKGAVDRMQAILDDRRNAVNRFAQRSPLPLGNDRYYGLRQRDGNRKIDAAKAMPVLEQFGLSDAVEYHEPTVTVGAVEKLARQKKRGLALQVEKALESAGALTRGAPYSVFEVYKRKEEP